MARADWGVAYERDAGDLRQAVPIVSADGQTVWSAGMEHALATGRFRRLITLDALEAVLPDGRGVAVEPGRRAIVIARIEDGTSRVRVRTRGIVGRVRATLDGRFVVAHEGRSIVVRGASDLRVHRVLMTLASDDEDPSIEALADGGVLVLRRDQTCDADGCAVTRIDPETGATTDVGWRAHAHQARASRGGDVVVTVEGAQQIVVHDATTGALVATLPNVAGRVIDVAVAQHGDVVAVALPSALTVYVRRGAAMERSASFAHGNDQDDDAFGGVPSALAFSPDGTRLAAGGDGLLVLSRDRAPNAPRSVPPTYTATVPTGFGPGDPAGLRVRAARLSSGWSATPRLLMHVEREDATTSVTVTAHDADEMADFTQLGAWGVEVVRRYVEPAREIPVARLRHMVRVRRDEHGRRVVELLGIVGGGCDPTDDYHRFVEDGGFLVHVVIATYVPFAELGPLFTAFLDAPFRATAAPRARIAMLTRGGCGGP